jgi:hypothetical protein
VGGIAHAVLDPRGVVLLLSACQAHHLGGNIDAQDLRGTALLEQPGVETEATGQIQDALASEFTHHAEEGITLGALQGSRPRVFVIFAANMVILCCLLYTVFLLGLVTCSRLPPTQSRGAPTVTSSDNQALSALTLWSMTDVGKEVVKVP